MDNIFVREKTSIFQRIETLIRTIGELPDNFEAEEREYEENELRFAPGALEGIFGHHTAREGEDCSFAETLKEYLKLDRAEALRRFEEEEAKTFQTASVSSPLLNEIMQHQEDYVAEDVANLGYYFAWKGTKCEAVKLGLTLLSLFNFSNNEQVCYLFQNLGYCEEFTGYVTMNIADWEESKKQELYFELAKKLKGWGKIDVVEEMVADTEEKKEWILCHGCKNTVMNSYLAYVCVQKCELAARLEKGNLTEEQLQGVSDIMEGLIDEGPCRGMSIVEKPVELTLNYLREVEKYPLDVDSVQLLCWIYDYFENSEIEDAKRVCEKLQQIWKPMDMKKLIAENLAEKTHACVQIGKRFEVDLSKPLFELMQENFSKYFTYCFYLFQKERFVDDFFDLCEREIDGRRYPKQMGNSLGLGKLGDGILALDMIVQYMGKYPLKGRKLLALSIQSPITRWRNMAARTMQEWTQKLNKPLAQIDVGLYSMVKDVAAIECNATTKEMWDKLLGGQIRKV
ncbi:MAG: hypothetical protein IJ379_02105 [Lachnospiraceae bacterium]|nr:hypothetical protein [Lachnospiraceae bacterium]